jgi:hypothetical protein
MYKVQKPISSLHVLLGGVAEQTANLQMQLPHSCYQFPKVGRHYQYWQSGGNDNRTAM